MHTRPGPAIADLKPGDHLCLIYETEEEHRAVLTPFLRQGLERGEKVIYIVDTHTAETVLGYLRDDGLAPEPYLDRGQLVILTCDDACMRDGIFDPDGMIALLRAETEKALAEGYPALRVTGEMSWALRGLPGSDRLIEYEAKLNKFFPRSKCLAICQYDRRRFASEVLLNVLRTHPIAIIGTEVYENLYYIPPAELLRGDRPAVELQRWLKNLAEHKQAEEALRESEERFRTITEKSLAGVYIIQDGKFRYVNPALAKFFGYRRKELIDKLGPLDLTHPDDRPRVAEHIRLRLEGEVKSAHYTFRGLRKDGSVIHCEVLGRHTVYRGRPAIIGTLLDITARFQAQEERRKRYEQVLRTIRGVAQAIATVVEVRDPYTAGHQRRVSQLAVAIAREMGLPRERIEGLRVAALLHDIGKVRVPSDILNKPGSLAEPERAIIQTHPEEGYRILKEIDFPWPVAEIVLQHHERLDGSGYPQGLKGEEILLEARILAVADVVEAMSYHRPYRPALGIDKALEEIAKKKGVLYDPKVVDACLALFAEQGFAFEKKA